MEYLTGRQYVVKKENLTDETDLLIRPAMTVTEKRVICQRCGWQFLKREVQLPNNQYYCPACIEFGRITSDSVLVTKRSCAMPMASSAIRFSWEGKLTVQQKQIADALVKNYHNGQSSLIWAVTGSGKTEMLFLLLAECLKQGAKIAIASPRIDVCRELFPRIQLAFPEVDVLLRYGDAVEEYRDNQLLICTTHQLLHFFQAFDLLIIDEIDAFPFEGDQRLHHAVQQALKVDGKLVYLTATPSEKLLAEVTPGFAIHKLPIRFHKRPLVVPELVWMDRWHEISSLERNQQRLIQLLIELLKENHVLLFCPSIALMERLAVKLQNHFTEIQVESVSAQDPIREEKVLQMRRQKYQIFLCTTILERGVTFENISVIVFGANHEVYTKSALVQIAGRVDRKGDFTNGRVLFVYDVMTYPMRKSIAEIKKMNQLAECEGMQDEV